MFISNVCVFLKSVRVDGMSKHMHSRYSADCAIRLVDYHKIRSTGSNSIRDKPAAMIISLPMNTKQLITLT